MHKELDELVQDFKNPLVYILFGIIFGFYIFLQNIPISGVIFIAATIFLISLIGKNKKIFLLSLSLLFGFIFTFVYENVSFVDLSKWKTFNKNELLFVCEILDKDYSNKYSKKYIAEIESIISDGNREKLKAKVLLNINSDLNILPGERYVLKGKLANPKGPILPGLFSEINYLKQKNICFVLNSKYGSITYLGRNRFYPGYYIEKIREKLIINNPNFNPSESSIINGIVFGTKAFKMQKDLSAKFKRLGINHITSASGFNITILTSLVFFLFTRVTSVRVIPVLLSIGLILSYMSLADFSSSIIRAAIFNIIVLMGLLFNRKIKVLPSIAFIVILFFLISPNNFLDVGLQLSVFSFCGIVCFGNVVYENFLKSRLIILNFFSQIILTTFLAQVFVLPLLLFYFKSFSLIAFLSNILAVPLASFILVLGLIMIFLEIFNLNLLSQVVAFFLKFCTDILLTWVNFLSSYSPGVIKFNIQDVYLIFYFYFLLFCIFVFFLLKQYIRFSCILLLFVLFVCSLVGFQSNCEGKVFFITSYNKDNTFILLPDENPVLITSSKKPNLSYVKEYLDKNNIAKDLKVYNLNDGIKLKYIFSDPYKINVRFANSSIDIYKNYKKRISSNASCVKLPSLMAKDKSIQGKIIRLPSCVVINDNKKLSKNSIQNKQWLKSKYPQIKFLSESGTVSLDL